MRLLTLALALPLASLCAGAALADPVALGDLALSDAYSPETPPRATSGAGYVTITNSGATDDRLIAAASPGLEVMIHQSMTDATGITRMEHQMQGIAIPAGQTVTLAPGGYHLMIMDLPGPLVAGQTLPLTLTFQQAGSVTLDLPIMGRGGLDTGGMDTGGMENGAMDHGAMDNGAVTPPN